MFKVLVTGAAGFIGFHLSQYLLKEQYRVIGIDNLNPYYDVSLKQNRLNQLKNQKDFSFYQLDLANRESVSEIIC